MIWVHAIVLNCYDLLGTKQMTAKTNGGLTVTGYCALQIWQMAENIYEAQQPLAQ